MQHLPKSWNVSAGSMYGYGIKLPIALSRGQIASGTWCFPMLNFYHHCEVALGNVLRAKGDAQVQAVVAELAVHM